MTTIDETSRSGLRDGLADAGFVPAVSKLYPPTPGLVARRALVDRVGAARGDVVTITAPAGYGKSTFAAELCAHDERPTAWVSLSSNESDPRMLLTYMAVALDVLEPVEPGSVVGLWSGPFNLGSSAVQRFAAMLASLAPCVLVLDDVHELVHREVIDVLTMVISALPKGTTIVLVGRAAVPLRLGRLRAARRLVEVGLTDLAFDHAEAATLFDGLAVELEEAQVTRLVQRTEGWPVALHLAALAEVGNRSGSGLDDFGGDHRYLVDFLGEELLSRLDSDVAEFLLQAACLERLSGPVCDEILGRRDSARLLDAVQRQNLLVIPLDDRREWYRFHHLMAEFLYDELSRRDPVRLAAIHRRASDWFGTQADADSAVRHAVLSGDMDHAESMVLQWYSLVGASSRPSITADRWIGLFPAEALDSRPFLMVVAAWSTFSNGDRPGTFRWLDRAVLALPDRRPPAQGFGMATAAALAEAFMRPMPVDEMLDEAAYVYDHVGRGEGHPMSCLLLGAGRYLRGDLDEAARVLREGAASHLERPLVEANCLALVAMLVAERGEWATAQEHVRRARLLLGESVILPSAAVVLAVGVLVDTHAARSGPSIEQDRMLCRQHLASLFGMAPWMTVTALLALAQAAVVRGDRGEANALVDEAEAILGEVAGASHVATRLASLRHEANARERWQTFGPSSLTTAELRVLQLLPTHLSVAEIAERLYVSRNTVKSHTISIYRKLGTSSRSGAVELATEAGLLDGPARR